MLGSTPARWARSAVALALICALAVATARATTFEEDQLDCASCDKSFSGVQVNSANTYGGIDADGCRTANGDTPFAYLVHVCPHCLAARFPAIQDQPPRGEEAAQFLAAAVKARSFPEDAAQRDIPSATKIELACGLLGAEDRHPHLRATLWQFAAWTARGEARAALIHPEATWSKDVPAEWRELQGENWQARAVVDRRVAGARTYTGREILAAQRIASAEGTSTADRAMRRLYRAVVLRCHGELVAASGALEAVPTTEEQADPDEARLRSWIDATQAALAKDILAERSFLERVLYADAEFGLDEELGFPVLWREAECRRRLGQDEEATAWLQRMLAHEEMDLPTLVLLRDAAVWAGDATPKWRAAVIEAWDARIAALVASLSDIDTGESAAAQLAQLADPSVFGSLQALLTDEDAGANAAAALAGYPAPQADVLTSIEKLAADPDYDSFARWSLFDTLVAWSGPSSAAAFRAVLAEEGDDLLEHALRGIGRTGTQADVPTVLARAGEDPETALAAVTLLLGRSFESMGAFTTWWAEHRTEKDLAGTALIDAGIDAKQLGDREAVPALIGLLDDSRLPVRWTAYRRLCAITGQCIAPLQILHEGRARNPDSPDVELDLERVLGDGWTVWYRGTVAIDMEAWGALMKPLRDSDGQGQWQRAQARWKHWWAANR